MKKPQPFVVPAGVTFQITDAGVVIENEGDIVLHTNFGRSLTRIVSTAGSITIHAPVEGGTLHAAGDVSVHGEVRVAQLQAGGNVTVGGDVRAEALTAGGNVSVDGDATTDRLEAGGDVGVRGGANGGAVRAGGTVTVAGAVKADTVHARVIRFEGPSVTARGVQAGNAVHLGAAKLQVDAVIAPEVHLDPGTNGRATVIESHNELGPNALKGGFRLADYAEMFGDPASFLAERGLAPIGAAVAAPPPVAAPVAAPAAAPAAAPVAATVSAPMALADSARTVTDEAADEPPVVEPEAHEEEPVEVEAEPAEADGDPTTNSGEQSPVSMEVEESEEVPAPPPEHPLHKQLVEAVTRIGESYADAELPPAVNHLMSLIETRAYDQVRAEITAIWSDLLKYHQKKGLRIQHQVTTTFNTINSLVKKM